MKKIFRISLVVLLVLAFTVAALQVLPGCQGTSGFACTNVGWNSRAASYSPVAYVVHPSSGTLQRVGWNS
jgi:hypothetical protein